MFEVNTHFNQPFSLSNPVLANFDILGVDNLLFEVVKSIWHFLSNIVSVFSSFINIFVNFFFDLPVIAWTKSINDLVEEDKNQVDYDVKGCNTNHEHSKDIIKVSWNGNIQDVQQKMCEYVDAKLIKYFNFVIKFSLERSHRQKISQVYCTKFQQ